MRDHVKRSGRLARCVTVAALALGVVPAAAAADCPTQPTSMVFAPWGDTSDYFLAPGGDFERSWTSWSGGSLTAGNYPFYLAGGGDRQSYLVAEDTTAMSPWFCADVTHPDFRFVAQPLDARNPGSLQISVRFRDRWGTTQTWQMWTMSGVQYWTASPRVRLMRDLPLPDSGETSARVMFRAVGGHWAVDDVFIDPYRK
jgi:hypothetical protein